jgi:TonB family protein
VAGVETNQKIRIRGNQSGALRESSSLTGRVVTGQVSDENGEPLPGVTIGVKGTTVGAVTNAAGGYTLSLPEGIKEATLTYSFIGFTTTEKQVTALAAPLVLNIALKPDARALSEVVVVGYGTQAKSEVTGAVTYARPTTGFKAFKRYIQANIKYPETAGANKIKGRVVVGFTVDPNGTLSDFRIIKSLSAACDAEALRLLQEGPRWEPTKKDGLAVSEQVRIAIRFKPY